MIAVLLALVVSFQIQVRAPQQDQAPGTAVITGRVLGADGRPVVAADVRAVPLDRGSFNRMVQTGPDGRYELTALRAGHYRVVASKSGFLTIEYRQPAPFESGAIIEIRDGQHIEDIDIALARHAAIVGHVFDETGDPVEGASVRVSQIAFIQGRRQLVNVSGVNDRLTDDRGRFRVWGLPPGHYIVSAVVGQVEFPGPSMLDMPGYAPTFYPGSPTAGGAAPVDVGLSTDVTGIDFSLAPSPTARVYGQALFSSGDPVRGGLTMRSTERAGGVLSEVGAIINTDDGTFIFPNVAPGEYVIQVVQGRLNNSTEGEFASQIVQVNGADVRDVNLRASAGSELTGRIRFEDTASLSPGDIELTPVPADQDHAPADPNQIAEAEIHDDWTFALAGLHGPRRLRLTRAPAGWLLKAVLVDGVDVTDQAVEFGSPKQSLHDVEVVLTQSGAEIAGTVADASGAPAAKGFVIVFPTDRSQWAPDSRFLKMAVLTDGTFDLTGLPGADYYVAAVTRLSGDEWQDPALLEQLLPTAAQVFASAGQKATVAPSLIVR